MQIINEYYFEGQYNTKCIEKCFISAQITNIEIASDH